MRDRPRLPCHFGSIFEDHKGRDAAHAETPCRLLVLIGVQFHKNKLTGVLLAELFKGRCKGATRAAPRGPNIDHNGEGAFVDQVLQAFVTGLDDGSMNGQS